MKQITQRNINLKVISRLNNLSRNYAAGNMDAAQGINEINRLKYDCCYSKKTVMFAGVFASATATILFGGTWQDIIPTLLTSTFVWLIMYIKVTNFPHVLKIYLAGLAVGLIASIFVGKGFGVQLDRIIVGSVIPLLPGLAMTSAVRDYISGDLLSGTIRTAETLLITLSLASGIATGLSMFLHLIRGI